MLLSELTAKYRDARGMLLVGKLARCRPRRRAARPCGVPDAGRAGLQADRPAGRARDRLGRSRGRRAGSIRKTVSTASAYGLMQVTPAAGKYIAGKFGATFDQKRLLSDQPYNVQFGAAGLGDLIKDYRGSYIHDLCGLQRRPRPGDANGSPTVRRSARSQGRSDRLGRSASRSSETRNYVQRVMENMQVYRVALRSLCTSFSSRLISGAA